MRAIYRPLLYPLLLAVALATSAQARGLKMEQFSSEEQEQVAELANTEIRADLNKNLYTRMYEAAATNEDPPLSAETRAVMARGAYMLINGYLSPVGIHISEYSFTQKVEQILNKVAAMGLYPHAFTVGNIGHLKFGVGAAAGVEFNFYIEKGDLKLASYSIVGGQLGAAAKASDQFYFALCYGSCTGGEASGMYIGADFSADFGIGVDAYVEFGLDFTDAIKSWFRGKSYSMKDLYDSRVVYVGFGFDIGIGVGLSGNVLYYSEMFDKTLAHLGGKSSFDPKLLTQYDLKKYR